MPDRFTNWPQVHGEASPQPLDNGAEGPAGAAAAAETDADEKRQRQALVEEAVHQQMDMQKQLQSQLEVRRSCELSLGFLVPTNSRHWVMPG